MKNNAVHPNILKYSLLNNPVRVPASEQPDTPEPVDRFTPSPIWSHSHDASVTARLISSGIIGLRDEANIRIGDDAEPATADPTQWDKRASRKMATMQGGHSGLRLARVLFGR